MGYLKKVGTTIIYIGAIFAAITFIPGIPPDAKFAEYSIVKPKELGNNLAFNDRLNNAEILFKGQVKGAEAFDSWNGELYTSAHGGYVLRLTEKELVPIVKFGQDCHGIWQEAKCGRPLGLKFDKKGTLYVSDAYYGIFKVDIKTKKYEKLVGKEPIEGKVPMITNSLDIASNGDIYWSDSSTEFTLQDGTYTMISNPSGRLIRYNAATKTNQVLVHDLGFANGVALSKNEDFVIVLETLTSRITKYYIKGPKAGKREIFIEGLPGLPDNVHPDNHGGFLVSLVVYGDSEHPLLHQSLMPHPYIRRLAMRLLYLLEAPFKCLNEYYPNYYAERIVHYIGGFESATFLNKKIATVIRIDENGQILDAAYNTDEKVHGISSAFIHGDYLWLGSPWLEFIPRVPLKQAFPSIATQKVNIQTPGENKNIKKRSSEDSPKQEKKSSTAQAPKVEEPKPTPKPNAEATPNKQKLKSSQSNGKKSSKN